MLHDLNIINYRSYKSVSIYIINNNINICNYIVIHNITMCIIPDHNTHNDIVNKIMLIIILIRMILIRTLLLIILLIMILFITIFDDLSIDDNWHMRTGSYQTKKHETKWNFIVVLTIIISVRIWCIFLFFSFIVQRLNSVRISVIGSITIIRFKLFLCFVYRILLIRLLSGK